MGRGSSLSPFGERQGSRADPARVEDGIYGGKRIWRSAPDLCPVYCSAFQSHHFQLLARLYGGKSPSDYTRKFEEPYKSLLAGGVKFYASLGNHDDPNERFYKPFNMSGRRYYSFQRGEATFFALDSTYMDVAQIDWLDQELSRAKTPWKVCYFHHPLYSDARHGPDLDLRSRLEPVFQKYGVNVVLSGHEHVYERIIPQHGVLCFILGNSGELRYRDLRSSSLMAKGFDTDQTFGVFELSRQQTAVSVSDSIPFRTDCRQRSVQTRSGPRRRPRCASGDPGYVQVPCHGESGEVAVALHTLFIRGHKKHRPISCIRCAISHI